MWPKKDDVVEVWIDEAVLHIDSDTPPSSSDSAPANGRRGRWVPGARVVSRRDAVPAVPGPVRVMARYTVTFDPPNDVQLRGPRGDAAQPLLIHNLHLAHVRPMSVGADVHSLTGAYFMRCIRPLGIIAQTDNFWGHVTYEENLDVDLPIQRVRELARLTDKGEGSIMLKCHRGDVDDEDHENSGVPRAPVRSVNTADSEFVNGNGDHQVKETETPEPTYYAQFGQSKAGRIPVDFVWNDLTVYSGNLIGPVVNREGSCKLENVDEGWTCDDVSVARLRPKKSKNTALKGDKALFGKTIRGYRHVFARVVECYENVDNVVIARVAFEDDTEDYFHVKVLEKVVKDPCAYILPTEGKMKRARKRSARQSGSKRKASRETSEPVANVRLTVARNERSVERANQRETGQPKSFELPEEEAMQASRNRNDDEQRAEKDSRPAQPSSDTQVPTQTSSQPTGERPLPIPNVLAKRTRRMSYPSYDYDRQGADVHPMTRKLASRVGLLGGPRTRAIAHRPPVPASEVFCDSCFSADDTSLMYMCSSCTGFWHAFCLPVGSPTEAAFVGPCCSKEESKGGLTVLSWRIGPRHVKKSHVMDGEVLLRGKGWVPVATLSKSQLQQGVEEYFKQATLLHLTDRVSRGFVALQRNTFSHNSTATRREWSFVNDVELGLVLETFQAFPGGTPGPLPTETVNMCGSADGSTRTLLFERSSSINVFPTMTQVERSIWDLVAQLEKEGSVASDYVNRVVLLHGVQSSEEASEVLRPLPWTRAPEPFYWVQCEGNVEVVLRYSEDLEMQVPSKSVLMVAGLAASAFTPFLGRFCDESSYGLLLCH